MFGQRLRHARRARGLTLADLGARVGRTPSVLSLIENGKREPRLSLVEQLAAALGVPVSELLKKQPPSRRAQLEIALEQAQRDPSYAALGLPELRVGTRVPTDVLEHLVAPGRRAAGAARQAHRHPGGGARRERGAARLAARARQLLRRASSAAAADALDRAGYAGGALVPGHAAHRWSPGTASPSGSPADLPRSVRSLTDLRARRIYLKQEPVGGHSPRAVILQSLGHFLLGHDTPRDFADFLRQRVEANYFAAAMLIPERAAVPFLRAAKDRRDLAVEDLVDVFSVSYEMAAHRVTNLITHHLGVPCHFVKNDASGVIYKAYQNDGVVFPADATGAIEGQRMCRQWSGRQVFAADDRYSPHYQYSDTPSGTYFCVAQVDPSAGDAGYAITLGVPFDHSRWFRGRESTIRTRSRCPDGDCCQRAPAALAERWEGMAWPSARAHSHVLSVLPSGAFPGVDDVDIYEFLDRHAAD